MEASEVDEEREGEGVGVHCTMKLYKNTKLQNVLYKDVNIHVCPFMMVL